MYLFDANIFLEILLDQDQAAVCERAVSSLSEEKPCWVTSFSLHGIEAILSSRRGYEAVLEDFLQKVMGSALINRYDTTTKEEAEVNMLTRKVGLDFDDSLQYYVARKMGLTLVTLDRDFKKITDVPIVSPEEI